jgi:hypothetical protein
MVWDHHGVSIDQQLADRIEVMDFEALSKDLMGLNAGRNMHLVCMFRAMASLFFCRRWDWSRQAAQQAGVDLMSIGKRKIPK